MADSKKYNGSTWEHSLRKLATATDTFTTLPADIYADGNNATVGLKGNTVQSGTPTPDNPIMPQGTGERTAQLFDKNTVTHNAYVNDFTGAIEFYTGNLWASDYIDISGASYVSISKQWENEWGAFYGADKVFISGINRYSNALQIPDNAKYMRLTVKTTVFSSFMVNLGSTALPYEPYGYKIPILSAGQTNNIYLGEVESTRRIKKLVLTGEETWNASSTYIGSCYAYLTNVAPDAQPDSPMVCTHVDNHQGTYLYGNGRIDWNSLSLWLFDSAVTVADFKTYLRQQYAAGTPVTVWYVLATEQTAVVNEPLMKIGDYADTVSGITVPTITGKDTFDVETTLKPSEVSLSYTGWHDATVEEWDGSQWNE